MFAWTIRKARIEYYLVEKGGLPGYYHSGAAVCADEEAGLLRTEFSFSSDLPWLTASTNVELYCPIYAFPFYLCFRQVIVFVDKLPLLTVIFVSSY
jgi:hypothetical protein